MATIDVPERASVFEQHRGLLFGIAYRMLGSAAEAEDVVQETWLRFQSAADVESPRAWLSTVASRLSLDRLRSARVQREQYVGPWLPEPIVEPIDGTPPLEETVGSREVLSMAAMVLLEVLQPTERAVFILSEAFGYSHREIAATLGLSAANSRQLLHRARQRLAERERRYTTTASERRQLTEALARATGSGDLGTLTALLTEDVVLWADGGGKVPSALNPIFGQDRVARFAVGALSKDPPDRFDLVLVNGEPGLVGWRRGRPHYIAVLECDGGQVREVRIIRNPEKFSYVRLERPARTQAPGPAAQPR